MSETVDWALTMLQTALEMEEKGRRFYEEAAQTTKNELGREIWILLGDYEVQHSLRIKEIYNSLQGGSGWTEQLAVFPVASDLGAVFRRLTREKKDYLTADTSDLEALQVGLDFESAAVKFYEQHLAAAQDDLARKFLELMVAEERGHLKLLSDFQLYLKDPESWFLEKDRAGLDGV